MNAPVLPYSDELKRKAIHLLALSMPVGLLVVGRPTALLVFVPLALFALLADVARQRITSVRTAFLKVFGPLMRPEELPPLGRPLILNGATWMCLSTALCAFLYPEPVAAAALVMLMLGDAAAAILGRRLGKHHFRGSTKSWEGTAAFFVVAAIATLPFGVSTLMSVMGQPPLSLLQIGLGALVAAVVEALPFPLNDNIRVPVLAGFVMILV